MKKEIPLNVLETIAPFVNRKGDTFESIEPAYFLIKFVDSDVKSDFYFNDESYKLDNGFQLLLDFKPSNKLSVGNNLEEC